jgi:hypothetical protein
MEDKATSEVDFGKAMQKARDLVLAGMEPDEAMREVGLRPKQTLPLPVRIPTTDAEELRDYVARLLRSLVPIDFGGLPLYVGMQSELPSIFQGISMCHGFVTASLDEILKPHLGTRYKGRGVAMFLSDCLVKEQLAEVDASNGMQARLFFTSMVTTAIHEAAHVLEWPEPFGSELRTEEVATQTQSVVQDLQSTKRQERRETIPYLQHEYCFIRNCVHLDYRADCGGIRVFSDRLAAGERYGLSAFSDYRRALGDEPQRMLDASFSEIRETPLPKIFWEQWRNDMLAYATRTQERIHKELAASKCR